MATPTAGGATVYPPVGLCIYCGSTNGALSKEHIIAYGLGGNLILPKASCESCAKITRDVEQFCLRPMLGPFRIRLNLPTRRPKERPNVLAIEYIRTDGRRERESVPTEDFPGVCIGFRFPAPGLLQGQPRRTPSRAPWWFGTSTKKCGNI